MGMGMGAGVGVGVGVGLCTDHGSLLTDNNPCDDMCGGGWSCEWFLLAKSV
jgi:hypothetical protein